MKKYCFLALVFLSPLYANIITTSDLMPIWNQLSILGPCDLVVFDVDHTLTVPKDLVLRYKGTDKARSIWGPLSENMTKSEQHTLYSRILIQADIELLDRSSPYLVFSLAKQGVPVIAETALNSGCFGVIKSLEKWRFDKLGSQMIDFSKAFPSICQASFPNLQKGGLLPAYYKGVLCSASQPKGEVLKALLRLVNFKPKRILFVDDSKSNLESVEKTFQDDDIEITGYLYTGAKPFLRARLNEDVAHFQMDHFLEAGYWLDDQKATDLLSLDQK